MGAQAVENQRQSSQIKNKKRGSSDHFQTPMWAIYLILSYIPDGAKIWEPACGEGNIVKHLMNNDITCHGTDLMHGFDFLSSFIEIPEFDMILTNPPFSTKDLWLEKCYDIGKPFALLLPITALEGKDRQAMYKKHGVEVLMPHKRVDYETPSGDGSGSWFYSAWFTHGLNLGNTLVFEEI